MEELKKLYKKQLDWMLLVLRLFLEQEATASTIA